MTRPDTTIRVDGEILRLLRPGTLAASQIAARLGTDQDIAKKLEGLRRRGLAERSTIAPGAWHITDAGRAYLEQLQADEP